MPRYSFTVCAHCEKTVLAVAIKYVHNPRHFNFYHAKQVEKAKEARQLLETEAEQSRQLLESEAELARQLQTESELDDESEPRMDESIKYELSEENKHGILATTRSIYSSTINLTLLEGVRYACAYIFSIYGEEEKARLLSHATPTFAKISDIIDEYFGHAALHVVDVVVDVVDEYYRAIARDTTGNIWQIIGITCSAIGFLAATKGMVNILWYSPPALPVCGNCSQTDVEGPGCIPFCDACGVCEDSNDWRDGSQRKYCMKICGNCDIVCSDTFNNNDNNNNSVNNSNNNNSNNNNNNNNNDNNNNNNSNIDEESDSESSCSSENEIEEDHIGAHEISSHQHLSTQIQHTFKLSLMLSYMLMVFGILLSFFANDVGDYLRMVFVAGSIGLNIGLRFLTQSAVTIKCRTCAKEDDIHTFNFEDSCQTWSGCCRANTDEVESVSKTDDCLEFERQHELEENDSVFEYEDVDDFDELRE